MNHPVITIIGPGRLGNALSKVFSDSQYKVKVFGKGDSVSEFGDITFITTPDSEIRKVASIIAHSNTDLSGKMFVHCSGSLPSAILGELKEQGAYIACFHPLQAVSQETNSFEDIYFDLEGDEEALAQLEKLVKSLGAKSFRVSAKEKELLHVSAVIASNYLVTLADLALRISESSTISQRELLNAFLPLMNSSIKNLGELSPSDALTGPISRGDTQTVQKHIKLLKDKPELLEIYKKLGLLTLELIGSEITDHSVKFRLYDLLK